MASNPHRGSAGGSLYGGGAPYRFGKTLVWLTKPRHWLWKQEVNKNTSDATKMRSSMLVKMKFFYVPLETFVGLDLDCEMMNVSANQYQAHKKQMVTWKQSLRYYQMGLLD